MACLKDGFKMLKRNLSSVILFEVLYKLFSIALLTPLIFFMFKLSIKLSGLDFLNQNNIKEFILSPATVAFLFIVLILLGVFFLINTSGLIYAMEMSKKGIKTNAIVIFLKGISNSIRLIRPRNMLFAPYVLLTVPFTYTVMISGSFLGIQIPQYITNFALENKRILSLLIIVLFILCAIGMEKIFSLNIFTVNRFHFKESMMISKEIIKKHRIKVLLGIVFLNIFLTLLLIGIEFGLMYGLKIILIKTATTYNFKFALQTTINMTFIGLYMVFSIISTPIIYSYICAYFYKLEEKFILGDKENSEHYIHKIDDTAEKNIIVKKRNKIITGFAIISAIMLNSLYVYLDLNNKYNLNLWYESRAMVTAHRGDMKHAPENTLAAIGLANEKGADIVEIDVRQTKDGRIVLSHDSNIKRVSGIDREIGQMTYDEIKDIDIGEYYSSGYAGEKIPLLEEVLAYAVEEDVFLNIEIKTAKTDTNIVEEVIRLIYEYDYQDDCVVASNNYKVIKKIKSIQPDLVTVFVMGVAIGDISDIEDADIFSVKHYYINADMVSAIHKKGKKIYAWTVNKEDDIRNMLLMGVDSIITDYPIKAKEIIYDSRDTFFTVLIKKMLDEY